MNTVNENVIVLIVEAAEMSERNGNRNVRNAIRKAIR